MTVYLDSNCIIYLVENHLVVHFTNNVRVSANFWYKGRTPVKLSRTETRDAWTKAIPLYLF